MDPYNQGALGRSRVFQGLGLASIYFLAAKWGLTLAFVQANATAIWPPTGIALAALLIGGWRLWPGIFLGAFLANLLTNGTVLTSLGIAVGNTSEALLGFYLVSRFSQGRNALGRTGNLFKFAILGGLVAPLLSATVGVGTLTLAGLSTPSQFKDVWLTWYLGDMGGALLVAPPILLWKKPFPGTVKPLRLIEGMILGGSVFFTAWLLFGGWSNFSAGNFHIQFLLLPILLWAAVRFGPFPASLAVMVLSLLAIQGTLHGFGPFHGTTDNQSLLLLQSFMSVTSVTILALACGLAERREAEENLRWSHSDLQLRVLERTEDLQKTNLILAREIGEKETLAHSLMESNEKFHLLSEATQEGVVITSDGVLIGANSVFCGIFGYPPDEIIGKKIEMFASEGSRETVRRYVSEGYERTYPVKGLRKNGSEIDLEVTGKTVRHDGETVRVTAIRDVTEQKRTEGLLNQKTAELVKSENHFRALIENALDIVTILDRRGTILFESPSVFRFLGYSQTELYGANAFTFVHPEDLFRVQETFAGVLEVPGNIRAVKFRFKHKDGSWKTLEAIGSNLLSDPAIKGVVVNSRDVTLEEEIRKALAEREERLRLLVENVQDYAIILLDPEGKVVTWNVGAQRIEGYEASEIIGQPISRFYPPEDIHVGKPKKLLDMAATDGRVEDEGLRVRKDGSRFLANVIITSLKDEKGKLRGFAKITRDITLRKRVEELARSNKELEQFAYVASHDLQEPLRMVTSFVQLLARKYEGKLDEEADMYIHQTVDGAARMRTLILDLLAYSRVDSAKEPFVKVDCAKALGQALSNMSATLKESGAVVESGDLPSVKGDVNQIIQLFQNLIGNAIKFKGPSAPKIRVDSKRRDGEWVLSVKDNGIGIDPKYSEQIFEIFKRLHTRAEYPGTGIGLAICKKVVARHGGRIWVESEAGKGATFYWTLPVLKEAALEHNPVP